eukprot:CAMPEP_0116084330 /NCGR_PEP_ID=MMETSP0327-20121206/3747_1 /TAXON_ID=44447 /ORGANISM="Pseudo-nitzschia delicatissima, Strain B596" /LENGTH=1201 /DNA_ID=CAMNT_0003575273 /DNA_START=88 /DNA_END=3693 /DNA_ORIENTATION=+
MATLSAVYTNLLLGSGVTTVCFLAFGLAVRCEANKNLTPRAWARPVKVLKNCLKQPYCLSWICWAMSLRYIDLLSGIQGTGTREQGKSGPTLRTNLDGIVLMRYHVLQFKVSLVATVLGMFMLLPLYYTSVCNPLLSGVNVCRELAELTDFEQLTIANVVPHYRMEIVLQNGTTEALNPYYNNQTLNDLDLINSIKWNWLPNITERYFACMLTTLVITLYTCYLLWHEWIECLALRRVYYLESEYYEERLDELNGILANKDPEDPFQRVRPPFLPHPEMRETVPNVSLHSALYKLPSNLCADFDPIKDEKSLLERQLEAAAIFFDQCIPAQKGFTSSIAAVTMVPDAKKLTKVWGKWYVLGNKMRKIKFLQRYLKRRKSMKKSGKKGLYDFFVAAPVCVAGQALKKIGGQKPSDESNNNIDDIVTSDKIIVNSTTKQDNFYDVEAYVKSQSKSEDDSDAGVNLIGETSSSSVVLNPDTQKRKEMYASSNPGGSTTFEYDDFDPVLFARWIGYSEETKLDGMIDTLEIEQLSVYAREMSQSASNPCVYGFAPETLRFASIEQLEGMLEDAWEASREANDALLEARAEMFRKVGGGEMNNNSFEKKKDKDELVVNTSEDANSEGENDKIQGDVEGKKLVTIAEDKNIEYEEDVSSIRSILDSQRSERTNGLRQRGKQKSMREKYEIAQGLVKESNDDFRSAHTTKTKQCCPGVMGGYMGRESAVAKNLTGGILDYPSYCVVTFTCRQAAVAARQCLADGKGIKSWEQVTNIPMNPLADAPPRNPLFCRGCCRPVTLTIPHHEKRTRKICTYTVYVLFCFLYTVPLTAVSLITNPAWLETYFPDNPTLKDPDSILFQGLAGFSSGYIYTIFFSILPQVFKILAFSEGTSSSKVEAEEKALLFYWYFMLVTAFTSNFLVQMLIAIFFEGNVTDEFKDILGKVAGSMVTTQAPVWINWIIVRTFNVLPASYLLQLMTFIYGWLRIHWFNRVMRGGGPGGPPPYRIYVDSGVVFMCVTSMAPIVPIIAPAACLYYLMFIPILRWLHIFVYRPFYDGGGNRLPIIHEMIISSLILGQTLLGTILLLKQSFLFGLITLFMTIPTYFFSIWTKEKFMRSYEDAALWQTSNLDALSTHGTNQEREKYRRWLVDCHKASYVPICVSGGEDFLTIQPAAVVSINESEGEKIFSTPRKPSPTGKKIAEKGALSR